MRGVEQDEMWVVIHSVFFSHPPKKNNNNNKIIIIIIIEFNINYLLLFVNDK